MSPAYGEFFDAHVLVTGAAAGIGRATALAFAAHGARVTAVDRDERGLATIAAQDGIAAWPCDLTDGAALARTTAGAERRFGPVRSLVNNAGVDTRFDLDAMHADEWRAMLAANLDHHFLLARALAPGMGASGGAIVNLSSTAWMKLAGRLVAYHAAKAGIVGLTRGLARDLGPRRIRVNAVAPGRVVTERVAASTDAAWIAETKALQCLPVLIEPADVAAAILWLCSDAARCVTGQTLVVDGGVV